MIVIDDEQCELIIRLPSISTMGLATLIFWNPICKFVIDDDVVCGALMLFFSLVWNTVFKLQTLQGTEALMS